MAMIGALLPYAYMGDDEEEEEEERKIMHYYSTHHILLVGDGDFSFSLCLARAFGDASFIVATSFDSYDVLMKKYKLASLNIEMLKSLGATVLHGVDAIQMSFHVDLRVRKFDRIIFNFPHAGFQRKEYNIEQIKMHRAIVKGFFRNARVMLRPCGEIHINHKTTPPFCYWNIEELAKESSLFLIDCVEFRKEDYPGYNNKRGAGPKPDKHFPLRKCSTYKFIFPASGRPSDIGTYWTQKVTYKRYKREGVERYSEGYIHELRLFDISRMAKTGKMRNSDYQLGAIRDLDIFHQFRGVQRFGSG